MSEPPAALTELIAPYLDEESGESELRAAAHWAGSNPLDIADLFDWLHRYPAARERKARAEVMLRAALGLPLVPGPVCRPTPLE